jgi:hypothetical protein
MPKSIVVGVGELGGVFARGLLRIGHTVIPARRGDDLVRVFEEHADAEVVIVSVPEDALGGVLDVLPPSLVSRAVLVQNDLRPRTWTERGVSDPSVAVVWFEKKPGREAKAIVPTVLFGDAATTCAEALSSLTLPTEVATDEAARDEALAIKNVYIVTTNLLGIGRGGTTGELLANDELDWRDAAREVLAVEELLFESAFDEARVLEGVRAAMAADSSHVCAGRTARARAEKFFARARELSIATTTLDRLVKL